MPRPLRIEYENAWYHVMNRGANKKPIFPSKLLVNIFLQLLADISERFKIEIHAYCLMNNHYHLLVRTPYANLSKAMKHLDGVYTQRLNKMLDRDGSLLRGRYKAIIIDSDDYLLQVGRYIHLNPVAAKLCHHPKNYKWSSYHAYTNTNSPITWLKTDFILNQMPGIDKHSSYAAFVDLGVDQETDLFYKKKHLPSIFGSKEFIATHLNSLNESYATCVTTDINFTKPLPSPDQILTAVIQHFDISANTLLESVRGKRNIPKLASIFLLNHLGQLKYQSISEIFPSLKSISMSTQLARIKQLISLDQEINDIIKQITQKLN